MILVGIPCLMGAYQTKQAILSVISESNVDLLIIENGSAQDVKEVISTFEDRPQVKVIRNEQNTYVCPVWNQIQEYFLANSRYDRLIIMNSDLVMAARWSEVLLNRWAIEPYEVCIPVIKDVMVGQVDDVEVGEAQVVSEGTPGVFLTLNRDQVNMVYPIPESIKIWFGDNWIYDILRGVGHETVIPENLLSYHYWSTSVSSNASEFHPIIEQDKIAWRDEVQEKVNLKIKELKI